MEQTTLIKKKDEYYPTLVSTCHKKKWRDILWQWTCLFQKYTFSWSWNFEIVFQNCNLKFYMYLTTWMDEVRFQIDVLHGWYYIFLIKDIGWYIGHWATHEDYNIIHVIHEEVASSEPLNWVMNEWLEKRRSCNFIRLSSSSFHPQEHRTIVEWTEWLQTIEVSVHARTKCIFHPCYKRTGQTSVLLSWTKQNRGGSIFNPAFIHRDTQQSRDHRDDYTVQKCPSWTHKSIFI